MKKILFSLLIAAISTTTLFGQTENVGINTTSPDNSAALHVSYVTTPKGVLIPRLTTAQRGSIASPANGLLIFNTDNNRFEVYDLAATAWRGLLSTAALSPSKFISTDASSNLQFVTFSQDLTATPTGVATVVGLQGRNVSVTGPTNGQILQWSTANTQWEPASPSAASGSSLDEAYDKGGAGVGRAITVDAGAIQLTGSNATDETIEITTSGNGGLALLENTGTGKTLVVNDEASDATPFTIDADGNVGVKSTTPTASLDVAGDFKLGTDGSVFKNVIKGTLNFGTGTIAASAIQVIEVAFTGAEIGGVVSVSPSKSLGSEVIFTYAFVSAADKITFVFYNKVNAAATVNAMDFYVTVIN